MAEHELSHRSGLQHGPELPGSYLPLGWQLADGGSALPPEALPGCPAWSRAVPAFGSEPVLVNEAGSFSSRPDQCCIAYGQRIVKRLFTTLRSWSDSGLAFKAEHAGVVLALEAIDPPAGAQARGEFISTYRKTPEAVIERRDLTERKRALKKSGPMTDEEFAVISAEFWRLNALVASFEATDEERQAHREIEPRWHDAVQRRG